MDESFDTVIKNGTVVLPGEVRRIDIGIRNGKIAALAEGMAPDSALCTMDAENQLVMCGMIDVHVHLNEPNLGHWEGFSTGSAALAAGGCTCYADMPLNGIPPTVNCKALELKRSLADGSSAVDYAFWGGLVPDNLEKLEELHAAGVVGFKAFMSNPGGEGEGRFREVDYTTLYEGMKRIAAFDGLLALHAESDAMTAELTEAALSEGRTGAADFAATRPVAAELEAVRQALEIAEITGCRLHFVHISSPETVDLIDAAKRRGLDVSLETCPHYLTLTETDLQTLGPVAKCAPPLRSGKSREALWKQLAEGKIDLISSDHSPCPETMKLNPEQNFFAAWGGIAGAQNSLELMLHEGWIRRWVPLPRLSALLSAHPAKRLGLYPGKGEIAVGFDADLAIVDPNREYTLQRGQLLHRHPHSPYIGKTFSCKVTATLCRGEQVYSEDNGIVRNGGGALIIPVSTLDAGRSSI